MESNEEVGAPEVESWLKPSWRGGRGISGEPGQGVDTPVAQISENKKDDAWARVVWNLQISNKESFGGFTLNQPWELVLTMSLRITHLGAYSNADTWALAFRDPD